MVTEVLRVHTAELSTRLRAATIGSSSSLLWCDDDVDVDVDDDEGGGDDDSINFGNYTIVFTEGLLVSEGEYLGMLSPSVAIQNGNVEIITAKGNKYTRSVSAVSPVCIPSPDFPTSTVILTCTCSVTEVLAKNGESLPSKTYEEKQVKTFKAPNY